MSSEDTTAIRYIDRTEANSALDQVPGVGVHQPEWVEIDCPQCYDDGSCWGHADVLSCKECSDDWPCDVAANVIVELEHQAELIGGAAEALRWRVQQLRGEIVPVSVPGSSGEVQGG